MAIGLMPHSRAIALQPAATESVADETSAEGAQPLPKVPPLPKGTPQELMAFVEKLKQVKLRPSSREEMMRYLGEVAKVQVQAADQILSQIKPSDDLYDDAAKLKLESLMMLGRMGDEKAAADMATFAQTLINSPSPELAKEAKRLVLVSEAQQMFATGTLDRGPELVQKTAAMLAADPNDPQSAGVAMQLAGALEQMPGGEPLAQAAYKAFGPILATSTNERVRAMGHSPPREQEAAQKQQVQEPSQPPRDLRGVSWGDSAEAVLASEKTLPFNKEQGKNDMSSLSSVEHELIGSEKAKIHYGFFQNRLVSVYYEFELCEARNPFVQDPPVRLMLEEKYGKGKTEVGGLENGAWDFSKGCFRETKWELPRTSIDLIASVFPAPQSNTDRRSLRLSYKAKNADQVEIERRIKESRKRWEDEQKKDTQKL